MLFAGVEEEAGDGDAVDVGDGHGRGAVGGQERGVAEAEDDGVLARDADGFGEVVDAGCEEEIVAGGQCGVDACCGVAGMRDEEVREWDAAAGRGAVVPGDAGGVVLERRDRRR